MQLDKLTIKQLENRITKLEARIDTIADIIRETKDPLVAKALSSQNLDYKKSLTSLKKEFEMRHL